MSSLSLPPAAVVNALAPAIRRAIEDAAGPGPCSVLYSGGLDSSIIACGASSAGPTLVAVGVRESHDLIAARSGAARLGLPLVTRELTVDDVRSAWKRWGIVLEGTDATARAVTLGLALALEATPPGPVLCGQGADELFLGYAHFRGLTAVEAEARRASDLARLRSADWPRAERVAHALHRTLHAPFLAPSVVEAVLGVEIAVHLPGVQDSKPVLRSIARANGVPAELATRPKKALQYGSGIARALAGLDRRSARVADLTTR